MFKTNSLDTAAYLYSQGIDCEIEPLNDSYGEFTFRGKDAAKLAEKFRRGDAVMSLTRYNNARTQLKFLGQKKLTYQRLKANNKL